MTVRHKVSIPFMQDLIKDGLQTAKLLGSVDVYLKLTQIQALALQQSLIRSSNQYLTSGSKPEPSVRFISVQIEENN